MTSACPIVATRWNATAFQMAAVVAKRQEERNDAATPKRPDTAVVGRPGKLLNVDRRRAVETQLSNRTVRTHYAGATVRCPRWPRRCVLGCGTNGCD